MSCQSHKQVSATEPSAPLPTISVDGIIIDELSFANELQYHQSENFGVVVQKAGQALVVKQLLQAQAAREGFEVLESSEEEVLQKLIAEKVSYSDPTDDDCLRYFKNNTNKFTTEPLMEVDHILLAAAKNDLPGREVAKNNAMDIISQLKQDPFQFPILAEQYSACPSKKMGGSLGQLSKGQTVPEFERQLAMRPKGLADKPIESRYGFHVVNITRKIEGQQLEYSMVEDKVRGYLIHRASHLAIQAYIQDLIEKAEITGIQMKFLEENIHI